MFQKPQSVPDRRPSFAERCILPLFSTRHCLAIAALVSALLFALPLLRLAVAEEAQPTIMYVTGVKSYPLVIGRAECTSNLWGYLCERYGVNPSDAVQLVLTEPSRLAEVYMKGVKHA